MTQISRSALVMYSAEQMFDLVNDVRRYPEFLQGCQTVDVLAESENIIEAALTLSKAGLHHSFTTKNSLVRPTKMEMTLVEGPFSKFRGTWHFQPLSPEACKVSLEMEFEMSNFITGAAVGAMFKQVASMMVDSFVNRAKEIYG